MTKKFLALLLAVVMVCAMGVIPVSAATTNEAKIGNTEYATLEAAFKAIEDDTSGADVTITLLDDVVLDGVQPFGPSYTYGLFHLVAENITLDLNGHDITIGTAINDYGLYFRNDTTTPYAVTIQNSAISASEESYIIDNSSSWRTINLNHSTRNVGPLTFNVGAGVTVKEGDGRVRPGSEGCTMCVLKNVTVNILKGAKLSAKKNDYVITGGADTGTENATNTINIYDGATVVHEGSGHAILSVGTVNIFGGTITTNGGSALYPAGSPTQDYNIVYNVSGGTITSENTVIATSNDKVTFNISGGTLTGNVALNDSSDANAGAILNVTGGSLTGNIEANKNAAVSISGGTVGSVTVSSDAKATISGGTIKGDLTAAKEDLTVTGGTFEDGDAQDLVEDLIADNTSNGNFEILDGVVRQKFTATFMADGKAVGTPVSYYAGDTELSTIPAVPAKEGYYGYWESYTLGDGDITINAKYVKIVERARVSFVADGKLVGIILYRPSQDALTALPNVPAKEGYVGTWAEYTLTGKNMIVRAVYTPIAE